MTDTPTREPKVLFGPVTDPVCPSIRYRVVECAGGAFGYYWQYSMHSTLDHKWSGWVFCFSGASLAVQQLLFARIVELEGRPDRAELDRLKDIADCARDRLRRFPPFDKEEWATLTDSNDDGQFLRMRIGRLTEAIERDIEAYNESINPDAFFVTEADLLAVAKRAAGLIQHWCAWEDEDVVPNDVQPPNPKNAAAQAVAEWREAREKPDTDAVERYRKPTEKTP